MRKPTLLALALLSALLCALGWPASLPRAQEIDLKVSHYLPPNHTVQKWLEQWAQTLDARSGGRIKLKIYPANQLGPVQRQFDLARNGQADMAVGLTGSTPGRYPLTELAALPFTHPAEGSSSTVASRRMTELAPKYLVREYPGLHVLWVGITPLNSILTASRPLVALSDFRGLKVRFQGEQHAKVVRALGAAPLQVPPGEIADGLSKGVIDGAVFNCEAAESFGLGSVTKHILRPGFIGGTLVLVINQAKYDALPPDLRALVDETTGPAGATALGTLWDAAEEHGCDYLRTNKVAFDTLPPDELAKLETILKPIAGEAVDALEKAGKPGAAMLADYTK